MNKFRKTLVVILSALFVLCMATFAACNSDSDAQAPEAPKAVYSVDVNVNDASLGTYTLTKANSGEGYTEGTVVTLTVTPKEDYDATLKINGTEVALDDNGSASFPVTRETQVEVNYNYKYQVYAYVAGGEGGTVELSDPVNGTQYAKNEPVTVTVTPKDGYDLKRVLVNGEEVETTKQDKAYKLNVEVDGRKYVVAEFVALHTVTVTKNSADKGDVTLKVEGEAVALTQNAVTLPEGTLVSLTVAPKEGESVKEVVVNGTPYFYKDDFTFELKKETTVEVVYDSYYKVTLPAATTGVQLQLVGAEEAKNGYLAGSVVTLKATLDEGYFVTKATVTVGEEGETDITDVLNAFGEYTFTVTDNVTVAVAVQSERDESYTVTVTYNNANFGTATLSEEGEEGKYVYGTSLTLTVTPVSNYYKVDYVTIDGVRVEPDAGKTNEYTFTVLKDTNIHVVFVEATSYTVCFELGDLLKKGYGVTVNGTALEEPTNKNDTFLTHVAYEGEDLAAVAITEPTDPTQKAEGELFCTVNDVKTLYNGTSFDLGEINSNVTVYITVETPAEPTVSASSEEELAQHSTMTQPISEFLKPIELDKKNNQYIFTFKDEVPKHAPVSDGTVYRFKGWQVTVNGVDVRDAYKPASAGIMLTAYEGYLFAPGESFAVKYNVDSAEMKVVIVPEWIETYTLTLAEVENCDITVTVDGDEQEGKPVEGGTEYTFDKDASVTVTLEPKDNYRFNGITTDPEGLVKAPEGEEQYRAFTIQNLSIKENVTITVAPLVQYAKLTYTVKAPDDDDSKKINFTEYYKLYTKDGEQETVYDAGTPESPKEYTFDVGTYLCLEMEFAPAGYHYRVTGWNIGNFTLFNVGGWNTGKMNPNGAFSAQGMDLTITYEKLTQKVTVNAENATVTINGTQYSDTPIDCNVLKDVTVEVTPIGDYVIDKVTVVTTKDGTTVEVNEKEGKYTFTMPSEPVTLTVTTLPKLTVSFPDPAKPEESTGAPTQGTWAAVDSADPDKPAEGHSLVIGANTLVVNGDPVKTIETQGEGGAVVYTLTTEDEEGNEKQYELAWFGEVEGYILALTDTTAAGTLPARRGAPRTNEGTTYYVNPNHVAEGKEFEGKFSALLGAWKPESGEILAFTEGESGAQVSLNGSLVKYLFALANNQYLLVVGTDAYDFTLTDTNTLTDNAANVEYKKAYKVTVDGTKVDGCSFTGVANGEYVAYDAELTLTFTLAEGYEAKVAVDNAEAEVVTDTYTLTVEKDLTLHVTYAKKQYTVTVAGDSSEYAHVTFDEQKDKYEVGTTVTFTVTVDDDYAIQSVTATGSEVTTVDASNGKYSVTVTNGNVVIKVETVAVVYVTFTLTGNENGNEATLTYGEGQTVQGGDKVPVGTKLTLTITVADGYKVKYSTKAVGSPEESYKSVTVSDIEVTAEGAYITVTFYELFTVTVANDAADNATVTFEPANDHGYEYDTKVTLTVTAAEGYEIQSVEADVLGALKDNMDGTYTLTVTENTIITVTTTKKQAITGINRLMLDGDQWLAMFLDGKGYEEDIGTLKGLLSLVAGEETISASSVEYISGEQRYKVLFSISALSGEEAPGKDYVIKVLYDETELSFPESIATETKEFSGKNFTLSLKDGKPTITVEAKTVAVEKAIDNIHNGNLVGQGEIDFYANLNGFTADDLSDLNAAKLMVGDTYGLSLKTGEVITTLGNNPIHFVFTIGTEITTAIGEQVLSLKIGEKTYPLQIAAGNWQGTYETATLRFTLSGAPGEQAKLTVTEKASEYTVQVNKKGGNDECKYELKNNDETVGEKVPAGATLTLTVTVPENYTATVKVAGATLENNGENSYTIKDIVDSVVITITYKGKGAAPEVQTLTITKFEIYNDVWVHLKMTNEDLALVDNSAQGSYQDYHITVNNKTFAQGYVTEYNTQLNVYLGDQKGATEFTFKWYNADNQLVATATWKVEKAEPKVTFEKGAEEAQGEGPKVELGSPDVQGVYTVKLPENTYTAPANKYFRGWKLNEVVYFPGEQLDVKSDTTLTAVWEDLYPLVEQDVTLSHTWVNAVNVVVTNGLPAAELTATVSDTATLASADDDAWHGILVDINMTIKGATAANFIRLRLDGFIFAFEDDPTNIPNIGVDNSKLNKAAYIALFADGGKAVQRVTASLSGRILTYTIATYADGTIDFATTEPVSSVTFNVESAVDVNSLTLAFYYDDGETGGVPNNTFTLENAKVKTPLALSENQAPTAEKPIVIGTTDNSLPYTGMTPVWTGDLKKGETVTLKGTMTSPGEANYTAPLMYVYNGVAPVFNLRFDNYINRATDGGNRWPMTTGNGWKISAATNVGSDSVNVENDWWVGVRNILKNANVEVIFDYSGENILLTIKVTGVGSTAGENEGKTALYTYTLEADTSPLGDVVKIGLGGDHCYAKFTSLTRTSVKSNSAGAQAQAQGRNHTTPRNYTLTQTEEVTLNSTVTLDGGDVEWRNLLVALDDENTLKFSPKGLYLNDESEALQADQMILDGAYSISECSISETVLDQYGAASVVITAVYSDGAIYLTYTVNGQQLASVTIIGATAESYSVCLG